MPSDTIYGLSCRALDGRAVKRLHQLKERDVHKPFIVLIADLKMLDQLSISQNAVVPVKKYWPGPVTAICQAPAAPAWLQLGTASLAIRLPAEQSLIELMRQTGPLISTSANRQGQEPLTSVDEAKKVFGEELDFYVDRGMLTGQPSTIVRLLSGAKIEVVRQGAVKIET